MARILQIGMMDKVVYINNIRSSKEKDSININFVTVFLDRPKELDRLVNHIAISWNRYQNKWDFDLLNYWGHASLAVWKILS